jgi:hypothetical protein
VCDRERDRKEREREREGEREGESQYIAMLAGIFCIDQTYLEVMILLLSLPKSWDLQGMLHRAHFHHSDLSEHEVESYIYIGFDIMFP